MVFGKQKYLTNKQIKKYIMTEREIFEKYANLNENELNTKNKEIYAINDIMTAVIKHFRGEKKEGKDKQMDSEKN